MAEGQIFSIPSACYNKGLTFFCKNAVEILTALCSFLGDLDETELSDDIKKQINDIECGEVRVFILKSEYHWQKCDLVEKMIELKDPIDVHMLEDHNFGNVLDVVVVPVQLDYDGADGSHFKWPTLQNKCVHVDVNGLHDTEAADVKSPCQLSEVKTHIRAVLEKSILNCLLMDYNRVQTKTERMATPQHEELLKVRDQLFNRIRGLLGQSNIKEMKAEARWISCRKIPDTVKERLKRLPLEVAGDYLAPIYKVYVKEGEFDKGKDKLEEQIVRIFHDEMGITPVIEVLPLKPEQLELFHAEADIEPSTPQSANKRTNNIAGSKEPTVIEPLPGAVFELSLNCIYRYKYLRDRATEIVRRAKKQVPIGQDKARLFVIGEAFGEITPEFIEAKFDTKWSQGCEMLSSVSLDDANIEDFRSEADILVLAFGGIPNKKEVDAVNLWCECHKLDVCEVIFLDVCRNATSSEDCHADVNRLKEYFPQKQDPAVHLSDLSGAIKTNIIRNIMRQITNLEGMFQKESLGDFAYELIGLRTECKLPEFHIKEQICQELLDSMVQELHNKFGKRFGGLFPEKNKVTIYCNGTVSEADKREMETATKSLMGQKGIQMHIHTTLPEPLELHYAESGSLVENDKGQLGTLGAYAEVIYKNEDSAFSVLLSKHIVNNAKDVFVHSSPYKYRLGECIAEGDGLLDIAALLSNGRKVGKSETALKEQNGQMTEIDKLEVTPDHFKFKDRNNRMKNGKVIGISSDPEERFQEYLGLREVYIWGAKSRPGVGLLRGIRYGMLDADSSKGHRCDMLQIVSFPNKAPFCQVGDSGAVVLADDPEDGTIVRIVGMLLGRQGDFYLAFKFSDGIKSLKKNTEHLTNPIKEFTVGLDTL